MGKTSNPALRRIDFDTYNVVPDSPLAMSLGGTVFATTMLLIFLLIGALWTWDMFFGIHTEKDLQMLYRFMWTGVWGSFFIGWLTIVKPGWAPFTGPSLRFLKDSPWVAYPPHSS